VGFAAYQAQVRALLEIREQGLARTQGSGIQLDPVLVDSGIVWTAPGTESVVKRPPAAGGGATAWAAAGTEAPSAHEGANGNAAAVPANLSLISSPACQPTPPKAMSRGLAHNGTVLGVSRPCAAALPPTLVRMWGDRHRGDSLVVGWSVVEYALDDGGVLG